MLEVLLDWRPVPLQRARSDRGVTHDTPRNRLVKGQVAEAWKIAHPGRLPFEKDIPLMVMLECFFDRPAAHYVGKRRTGDLREDAPRWHTNKPDGDNLLKLICDGLHRVAWADDAQIARKLVIKRWTCGDPYSLLSVDALRRCLELRT